MFIIQLIDKDSKNRWDGITIELKTIPQKDSSIILKNGQVVKVLHINYLVEASMDVRLVCEGK